MNPELKERPAEIARYQQEALRKKREGIYPLQFDWFDWFMLGVGFLLGLFWNWIFRLIF